MECRSAQAVRCRMGAGGIETGHATASIGAAAATGPVRSWRFAM